MGTLNLGSTGTIAATSLSLGVVPCFSARVNATNPFTTAGTSSPYTPIPFTHVDVNRGSCYGTNDGKFTCTLAGVYKFDVSLISGGTDHWFRGIMFHQPGGTGTPNQIAKSQSDYGGSSNEDFIASSIQANSPTRSQPLAAYHTLNSSPYPSVGGPMSF